MLEGIDALIALERFGTVSEAAVRLRLTQSAISKRIQALQRTVGMRLIERDGRRVRLTAHAIELLERARPLVADLRALTGFGPSESAAHFSLALADSIASSWGPAVIGRALASLAGISVRLHAHRSVLLIENVRLGRYHIGLSTDAPAAKDLIHYPVVHEPMVLVNAVTRPGAARALARSGTTRAGATGSAGRPAATGDRPLISIEQSSATWRAIEPQLRRHQPQLLARPLLPVETFSATVQMVKAGFGDGLVPLGIALEMQLDPRGYRELEGVSRHITLVTRKTVNQLSGFQRLCECLVNEAVEYFSQPMRHRRGSR
jgi:DNA-binding transcriptional LysR family regulator